MKKLLLILICLFLSFEVNSEQKLKDVDIEDCLLLLGAGKVIFQRDEEILKPTDPFGLTRVQTFFIFKTKTYVHSLIFKASKLHDSSCKVLK